MLDPINLSNAVVEGSDAGDFTGVPTKEISNQTQILRKVVRVSDTADATANYGRGRELQYQMVKAGASIKRDLEAILLANGVAGTTAGARTLGGFRALVGTTGTGHDVNTTGHTGTQADPDTGAVVVTTATVGVAGATASDPVTIAKGKLQAFEDAVLDMCAELYKANSKANVIMAHPSLAKAFSGLMEKYAAGGASADSANRVRYFENNKVLDLEVNQIITPLGQKFKIVFNRFMPVDATAGSHPIYFFNPSDWDQMVFRAPSVTNLAKLGSSESKMIEMEVSLRHRHPYASAVLTIAKA